MIEFTKSSMVKIMSYRIEIDRAYGLIDIVANHEKVFEWEADEDAYDGFYNYQRLAEFHDGVLELAPSFPYRASLIFASAHNALKAYSDLFRSLHFSMVEEFGDDYYVKLCLDEDQIDSGEKGNYLVGCFFPASENCIFDGLLKESMKQNIQLTDDNLYKGCRSLKFSIQSSHQVFEFMDFVQKYSESLWEDYWDNDNFLDYEEGGYEISQFYQLRDLNHLAYRRDCPYPFGSVEELMRERMDLARID